MVTPQDLLNQAKHFVEVHTAEVSRWKARVEELTVEVEQSAKGAVQAVKEAVTPSETPAEEPKQEEEAPKKKAKAKKAE